MNDWFFRQGGRDRVIDWLGLDSRIDSTVAGTWEWLKDAWEGASSFFARFQLTGWRRLVNELLSEAFSLTAGGLLVLYALALPAFLDFDEGKMLTGKYAVTFLDQNGNELGKRGILHNDAVPLEEIPDYLVKATLATEDRRFYEHWGVDFYGTARALFTNIQANDVVQGGSTITQQLAKNLFLSSERSIDRKIKEVFLSYLLESRYSKNEILKLYFDRAYMGGGAFGVEAASQFYFNKSVRGLNMAEAALLAGLFKAPAKYAPHINLPASRARTSEVLSNMVEAGFYSPGQVYAARINPARIAENRITSSPDWFLDWAFEEVQRLAEGKNQYVLTARVTIDLDLQKSAEEALRATIAKEGRYANARSGALVAMDVDGAVRAIVGGLDYAESQFNRATHARRQPGSSFKPYVYAAALENGFTSRSIVRDRYVTCGRWSPKNYDGSSGSGRSMPLGMALAYSTNTIAVDLSLKVGREKVVEMTRRLGIEGVKKTCSIALGDGGVTPIEHIGGYATFANGGKLAKPYAILDMVNSRGELIYSRERDEGEIPQVLERSVAEQMNQMMQLVVTSGTAKRANLDFTYSAGKTGTSSSYRDAWFIGYTGKYVAGVWIGNDDFRPMNRITGGSLPAETWHSFMTVAHKDMNIPPIPGLPIHPVQIAEQQRIADAAAYNARLNPDAGSGATTSVASPAKLMPDGTRATLATLRDVMLRLAGPDAVKPKDQGAAPPSPPTRPSPLQKTGSLRDTQVPPAATVTGLAPRGAVGRDIH